MSNHIPDFPITILTRNVKLITVDAVANAAVAPGSRPTASPTPSPRSPKSTRMPERSWGWTKKQRKHKLKPVLGLTNQWSSLSGS